jgi:hypothetical protein
MRIYVSIKKNNHLGGIVLKNLLVYLAADELVGTKALGLGFFVGRSGDGGDFASHGRSELDGQMAQTSNSHNGNRNSRLDTIMPKQIYHYNNNNKWMSLMYFMKNISHFGKYLDSGVLQRGIGSNSSTQQRSSSLVGQGLGNTNNEALVAAVVGRVSSLGDKSRGQLGGIASHKSHLANAIVLASMVTTGAVQA